MQFFDNILDALKKELERAKTTGQKAKPDELPSDLIAVMKIFDLSDEIIKQAKDLESAFKAHNETLVDLELGAARDSVKQANTLKSDAENQKDDAVTAKNEFEAKANAAIIQMDAAIVNANKAEEAKSKLEHETNEKILQYDSKIDELSIKIKELDSELSKQVDVNDKQSKALENILILILQDFLESHGLSDSDKRSFLNKLKDKVGDDISPLIKGMFEDLESKLTLSEALSSRLTSADTFAVDAFGQPPPTELQRSVSEGGRLPPLSRSQIRSLHSVSSPAEDSGSEVESLAVSQSGIRRRTSTQNIGGSNGDLTSEGSQSGSPPKRKF